MPAAGAAESVSGTKTVAQGAEAVGDPGAKDIRDGAHGHPKRAKATAGFVEEEQATCGVGCEEDIAGVFAAPIGIESGDERERPRGEDQKLQHEQRKVKRMKGFGVADIGLPIAHEIEIIDGGQSHEEDKVFKCLVWRHSAGLEFFREPFRDEFECLPFGR